MNELGRATPEQNREIREAIHAVISRGWLVHGPEHQAFEADLANYIGVAEAVGVASGTDALELAIRAVLAGAASDGRDVVVTVANAGGYSTVAARRAGCRVRYCDVDPGTHLIDARRLEEVLDDSVAAVVVTHLYGRVADVDAIRAASAPWGIPLVEDCAQAFGALQGEEQAGALGDVAAFSFYPTKNLGALGDGGAVVTDDAAVGARLRRLRQYGWGSKYRIVEDGGRNSRLDEIQAAVLRVRMPGVAAWNARRREIIGRYADAASGRIRVLPAVGPEHVGHLAVVETGDAAALATHLRAHEVGTDVHYPVPDHRQPAFAAEEAVHGSLEVTDSLVGRVLSVPCFPELRESEIDQVCRALHSY